MIEVDHHLEGSNVDGLEDSVIPVRTQLGTGDIDRVVVAAKGHLSVEEEAEWRLAPG